MKYILILMAFHCSLSINAQIDTTESIMFTDKYIAENNYKVVDTVGDLLHKSGKQMDTGLMIQVMAAVAAIGLNEANLSSTLKLGIPIVISAIGISIQLTGASNLKLSGKKIRELEFKNQ